MNEPTVVCGGLAYEEGADLDPDEVAENARLLPLPLDQLPGGGIYTPGTLVGVSLLFAGWAYIAIALATRRAAA